MWQSQCNILQFYFNFSNANFQSAMNSAICELSDDSVYQDSTTVHAVIKEITWGAFAFAFLSDFEIKVLLLTLISVLFTYLGYSTRLWLVSCTSAQKCEWTSFLTGPLQYYSQFIPCCFYHGATSFRPFATNLIHLFFCTQNCAPDFVRVSP